MARTESVETLIIGGGQAGLAMSHCLARLGRSHLVLEQAAQAGNAWRNDRWDSFTLVTPNWSVRLPDAEYAGPDPDGFMPRDEIVTYLERYAAPLPVRYGVRVTSVEPRADGRGHTVSAETAEQAQIFEARHVVVATGLFQRPKKAAFAASLAPGITQLASGEYRRPEALPPGAVLVMGAAQSGCQIAEELRQAGRDVYLSAGFAGRVPRRYRGKDFIRWFELIGFFEMTADQLDSPQLRFTPNPTLTGKDGGHTLHLRQFAREGVTLLGRARGVAGADGRTLLLEPGLNATLARIDTFEVEACAKVDGYISRAELDTTPPPDLPYLEPAPVEEHAELDLRAAGIGVIIWATGYDFDFRFVRSPVFDDAGYPIQSRGVTATPGLYFLGLPWLHSRRSGLFHGVGADAVWLAEHIARSSV